MLLRCIDTQILSPLFERQTINSNPIQTLNPNKKQAGIPLNPKPPKEHSCSAGGFFRV